MEKTNQPITNYFAMLRPQKRDEYPISKILGLLKKYGNCILSKERYYKNQIKILEYAKSINGKLMIKSSGSNCFLLELH